MTRLIDADKLKKAFEDTVCIEPMPYAFVKQIIDNAPTVDTGDEKYLEERDADAWESGYIQGLSERPHGKWEYQYSFCDEKIYKCTHCGRLLSIHNVQDISQFHFCQECGADMREADNDD